MERCGWALAWKRRPDRPAGPLARHTQRPSLPWLALLQAICTIVLQRTHAGLGIEQSMSRRPSCTARACVLLAAAQAAGQAAGQHHGPQEPAHKPRGIQGSCRLASGGGGSRGRGIAKEVAVADRPTKLVLLGGHRLVTVSTRLRPYSGQPRRPSLLPVAPPDQGS